MQYGTGNLARAATLEHAVRRLASRSYDRVILCQSRPGELPADTPTVLRSVAPDAQLMAAAGSWCEGELRTGKPWTDVPRVYWHQWQPAPRPQPLPSTPVLVNSRDYDSASAWIDVLADLCLPAVWAQRGRAEPLCRGAGLGVWDGGQLDGQEADALAEFCTRRRADGAPVVAVFDFPRPDTAAVANRLGVTAVLGKPWSTDAVRESVAACLSPQPQPQPQPLADSDSLDLPHAA